MNTTTTLARGGFIMIGTFLIGAVLTYAFNISMGWLLSPSEYGMLGVAQAVMGIAGLMIGAGFPWVVTKFMSEPGRQDKPTVFKSSLIANLILGLILCLLLYLSYALGALPLEQRYQPLLIMVIVITLITSVGGLYRGALQGLFRFKELGVIRCIQPFFLLLFSTILVLLGFNALGAMMGYAISGLIASIFALYYARDLKFWKAGLCIDKEVYSFAWPMFLGIIGIELLMNIDILGVKFFVPGMSDVMSGHYRATLVWARMPVFMVAALIGAFFPFISHHAGDRRRIAAYSWKTVKYALIFILPLSLACFAIPGPLITLIFPESYVAGAQALRILAISTFLLALIYIYSSVFQGVGKPKVPALILSGPIAIQIVCLYFLVPRYGLAGAAISTTSACVIGFALLQYAHIRYYGIQFDGMDFGKVASASIMLLAILYFFPTSGRLLTVLGLICGFGAFFVFLAATKFLNYSDADTLLSGVFGPENRFKSKVVGLVRGFNMATSESRSERVRTVERYLPFILALSALVSAMLIPSEVAVAAIFLFTLIIYALRGYNVVVLMLAALLLLISAAIASAWWGEAAANQAAIAAFYFLAAGVIGVVVDFVRRRDQRNKA